MKFQEVTDNAKFFLYAGHSGGFPSYVFEISRSLKRICRC